MPRERGAPTLRRPKRLTRQSMLFTAPDDTTFASQGPGAFPYDNYTEQERSILEKLPEDDSAYPTLPKPTFNLSELLNDGFLRKNGNKWEVAVDLEAADDSEEPSTAVLPIEELQSLSAEQLASLTSHQTEPMHLILRQLETDFRTTIHEYGVLNEANELNKQKYEEACRKMQHMAKATKALEKTLEDIKKGNPTAAEVAKYKQHASSYRELNKRSEAALAMAKQEREAAQKAAEELQLALDSRDDEAPTLQDMKDLQEKITTLETQLAEQQSRGRTSSRDSNRDRRSSFSRSLSRRRRGEDPPLNSQQPTPPPSGAGGDPPPSDDDSSDSSDSDNPKKKKSSKKAKKSKKPSRRISISDSDSSDDEEGDPVRYDPTMKNDFSTLRDVPLPTKFTGERDNKGVLSDIELEVWLRQLANKLGVTTFRTVPAALRYIHGCTDKLAWRMLDPYIPAVLMRKNEEPSASKPFKSVRAMLDFLETHFSEHDRVEKAQDSMDALKQTDSETFSVFYAKYQKYAARIPSLGASHDKRRLEKKLNFKYRNGLKMERYATEEALAHLCRDLEHKLERLEIDYPRKQPEPKKPAAPAPRANGTNAPSTNTTTPAAPSAPPRPGTAAAAHAAIAASISADAPLGRSPNTQLPLRPWSERPDEFKNLAPMTAEVRKDLITNSRCVRCRRAGHNAGDAACPLDAFERPSGKRKDLSNNGMTTTPEGSGESEKA